MSISVLQGSRAVLLKMSPTVDAPESPRLDVVILSLVRASGAFEAGRIELGAEGIPRPFDGATWRAEWNRVGKGWELRLGIPDSLFAASFDPVIRFGVEAATRGAKGRSVSLAALDVEVVPPRHAGDLDLPVWLPEESGISAGHLRF